MLRHLVARPIYFAAGLPMPPAPRTLLEAARELLPTLRPHGELALYAGEALRELRAGVDLFFSLAPAGCMVTTMGEALTTRLQELAGPVRGRIQSLFSADGELNEELLALALLRARGPGGRSALSPPIRRRRASNDSILGDEERRRGDPAIGLSASGHIGPAC